MKNIITNILGLIFWGFAVKDLFEKETSITYIASLVVIGGVLFLFENKKLKSVLSNIVSKSSLKVNSTVDPDKEFPDDKD